MFLISWTQLSAQAYLDTYQLKIAIYQKIALFHKLCNVKHCARTGLNKEFLISSMKWFSLRTDAINCLGNQNGGSVSLFAFGNGRSIQIW